jgi:isopenicillin N synthase-like dioxygenase
MWPSDDVLPNTSDFKATALDYYGQVVSLAKDVLKVLALTLDLEEGWFHDYLSGAVATM